MQLCVIIGDVARLVSGVTPSTSRKWHGGPFIGRIPRWRSSGSSTSTYSEYSPSSCWMDLTSAGLRLVGHVLHLRLLGKGLAVRFTLLSAVWGYPSCSIPRRTSACFDRTGCAKSCSTWISVCMGSPVSALPRQAGINLPSVCIGPPVAAIGVAAFQSFVQHRCKVSWYFFLSDYFVPLRSGGSSNLGPVCHCYSLLIHFSKIIQKLFSCWIALVTDCSGAALFWLGSGVRAHFDTNSQHR